MDLATVLRAVQALTPVVAANPAVALVFAAARAALPAQDRPTAKEAYDDLVADNDDGHQRLQEKLAAAAKR